MRIPFTKMHGIGNDYIYIDCLTFDIPSPEKLSREMSPRHFSVGADGIVLICPSNVADAKMRMFNADGSEGKICAETPSVASGNICMTTGSPTKRSFQSTH